MGEPRFLLLAVSGGSASTPYGIGWRLLGPNNRELGRGPAPTSSLDACRSAIEAVIARGPSADGELERGTRGLGWRWVLRDDAGQLARSGRLFHRERECRYSLSQFIHALPTAVVRWPSSVATLPVVSARAFAGVSADPLLNEEASA